MSIAGNIAGLARDFIAWLGDVWKGIAPRPLPRYALSITGTDVTLMRCVGNGYAPERAAEKGDHAPLLLGPGQAHTLRLEVDSAIARHGPGGARIEAARLTPFALEDAASVLQASPEPWGDKARWCFAAAQTKRIEALKDTARAAGAIPGPAFTLFQGAAFHLERRHRPALSLVAAFTALVIVLATISVFLGASQIEKAAETRLSAARFALEKAERDAKIAEAQRSNKAAPLEIARAAAALLRTAQPAAQTLADISLHLPDTAHVRRLTLRAGHVKADVIAPDAAALASALSHMPHIVSARLRSGAQTIGESGLQRATLELMLEPPK